MYTCPKSDLGATPVTRMLQAGLSIQVAPNLKNREVGDAGSFLPRHVFSLSFWNIFTPEVGSYPGLHAQWYPPSVFWQSAELPQYTGEGGPHSLMSGTQQDKGSPPKGLSLVSAELPNPYLTPQLWA